MPVAAPVLLVLGFAPEESLPELELPQPATITTDIATTAPIEAVRRKWASGIRNLLS
jgi:hypothetical protein